MDNYYKWCNMISNFKALQKTQPQSTLLASQVNCIKNPKRTPDNSSQALPNVKRVLLGSFSEASIILIPKSDKKAQENMTRSYNLF